MQYRVIPFTANIANNEGAAAAQLQHMIVSLAAEGVLADGSVRSASEASVDALSPMAPTDQSAPGTTLPSAIL
ncbi:hypothetical protein [Longimicrobium sp.]|uniref:hypothetical protein n=1 Tax=Longimicrobium sp. TaxID=2029185 RepID=UPI002C7EF506|nr:hypothetical protein [Longimicrobium sp.]HSU17497.1 hypothetical protein [Longimicrobium sp.]